MRLTWNVYVKHRLDDRTVESCHTGLSTEQVQALRMESHCAPGHLEEFDAIEEWQ